MTLFDLKNIAVEVLDYPISYVELIGTLFGLVSVYFATKANILTWSTGIINELFLKRVLELNSKVYVVHELSQSFLLREANISGSFHCPRRNGKTFTLKVSVVNESNLGRCFRSVKLNHKLV